MTKNPINYKKNIYFFVFLIFVDTQAFYEQMFIGYKYLAIFQDDKH